MIYQYGFNTLGNLTYAYDQLGRRTQAGGSFARTGLPGAVSSASYDAANELTNWNGIGLSYDANGNMLSDGSNSFTWNARNQVATLNNVSLQYDAFGRRIKNLAGTSFLYDGANAAQELSGSTVTANLLSGGIDEVFSRADSSGTFTPLKDALGSTIALTDSSGNVQTSYTYDSFGNTSVTGTSSTNEFQYTGRENEGNGLYYYRARYYSPLLGRFISEDPLEFSGSGPNFYAYSWDDPVNFTDPFGLSTTLLDPTQILDPVSTTGQRIAPWLVRFCIANPEACTVPVAAGAVGGITYERIQLEQAQTSELAAIAQSNQVQSWLNQVIMATPKGGKGCYDNNDVAAAVRRYPKKTNKPDEDHHVIPQYLGGPSNGFQWPVNSAYHQFITNAFRARWPYGSPKPTPQQLQSILNDVYRQFPWRKCP